MALLEPSPPTGAVGEAPWQAGDALEKGPRPSSCPLLVNPPRAPGVCGVSSGYLGLAVGQEEVGAALVFG